MKPKSIMFAHMTIHKANNDLLLMLYEIYDRNEAANIADLVMENITGKERIDRIIEKDRALSPGQHATLETYIDDLKKHKPVQYVLKEAWFAGLKLYVDENVLIPRPETEELAAWVIDEAAQLSKSKLTILDACTGSGCIAVAVKYKLPDSEVLATDISDQALDVARKNASLHGTPISFMVSDILDPLHWGIFPPIDILVSNPPYIPQSGKNTMNNNVLLHEPHLALFVTDNNPFVFYEALASFAKQKLNAGGKLFVEIHEDLAERTAVIFESNGFREVLIRRDMQGKERMIRAEK